MPQNPLNLVLPSLKKMKVQPENMLVKWIKGIKILNANRRQLLTVSNVKQVYTQGIQEVYPKNHPRALSLIREANSEEARGVWANLESYATSGNDDLDLQHFRLPHLTPKQIWKRLEYATYVDMLRKENPTQELNSRVVRCLLRRQLRKPDRFVYQQEERVKQILRAEKLYWKHMRQCEDDGEDE